MVELIIKNKDGKVVVTGNFNSTEDAISWINIEKQRKDWDDSYILEFAEKSTSRASSKSEDLDVIRQKETASKQSKESLKNTKPNMSINELSDAINKILQVLGLK